MRRVAVGVAALALAFAVQAAAHNPGAGKAHGYVATVASIQPNVLGLRAVVILGDQILVSNLTRSAVVVLDRAGRTFMRIPSGRSRAWRDARIVETGPPPSPTPGAGESDPRFVRNWSIPGRAGRQRFAILGFFGWVPPENEDAGPPGVLLAGGALAVVAVSVVAVYLLGRHRKA